MFGQTIKNDSIKKYVIYFGSLFSNISLLRDDTAGSSIQEMLVPIQYGPRDRDLARVEGNPDLEKPIALAVPRLSYEIVGMTYDSDRNLTNERIISNLQNDPTRKSFQYPPVPWNISFNLYVRVKNTIDGTRIIEQILPYFSPDYTGAILVDGVSYNIPLILNNVQPIDSYEGLFSDTSRTIIWVLTFTLKGFIFGPTISGDVINQVEVKFIAADGTEICNPDVNFEQTIFTPGLTVLGQPTTSHDNSIDKNLIKSTDNYGIIEDHISG
jgi:hypothetical protein